MSLTAVLCVKKNKVLDGSVLASIEGIVVQSFLKCIHMVSEKQMLLSSIQEQLGCKVLDCTAHAANLWKTGANGWKTSKLTCAILRRVWSLLLLQDACSSRCPWIT